jgi:aspartokinase/homoserine dehydrogenase 1
MMKVLKFGGTSIATPKHIEEIIDIIKTTRYQDSIRAVICSAFGGVTDNLIAISHHASSGNLSYKKQFIDLTQRHFNTFNAFVDISHQELKKDKLSEMLEELGEILHGVFMIKEITPRTLDYILSFGERLSCHIITRALCSSGYDAEYLDSRRLIITDDTFGKAKVDFEKSNRKIRKYFSAHKAMQVVTGFIASTGKNVTTTLGRSGSDYTASIIGAAINAEVIEIWTDVDGVMTSDPGKVKKAFPLRQLSYNEAMEMSHFGAKVIHPRTMHPAMAKKIPIKIRNTFNREFGGTIISAKKDSQKFTVKGISSISNIALIRVQGSGMVGVTGISGRLFSALAEHKINIILITQASSEHSICFVVDPDSVTEAREVIEKKFELEIKAHWIDEINVEKGLSIVAVVGENMRNTPGISGRVFQALGKNGINVVAIAQGSSELNISVVIKRTDEAKALNALHDAFFLSDTKSINLFIAGVGLIGSTLLKQIEIHAEYLRKEHALDINIVSLADIEKVVFYPQGIALNNWQSLIKNSKIEMNAEKYFRQINQANLSNSVFVDCTASDEIVTYYSKLLNASISIVTPNKKASSGPLKYYREIKNIAARRGVKFIYETNVGAGLPVISTLNDLIISGDRIFKIEAILSGSLSYIFNTFDGSKPFSAVVREAKEKGYTEPDPRDDLSGMDVARKLLILSRETGHALELSDIKIENLIPENCRSAKSVETFFKELVKADRIFDQKFREAQRNKKVLRYIASLKDGATEVKLEAVDMDHPFYFMSGSDNVISYTTERYSDRPLVIKGPGAGAEVTAAGVFADIIRIASYLS